MTLFLNRHIGKQVTVDLDTFFYYFVRPSSEIPEGEKSGITLESVRARLERMYGSIPKYALKEVEYRRSSKDHAHVRITFNKEISVLDGFMIRAFMLDDQTRLELDLARYLLTDDLNEMNRCFDEKAEMGIIRKAGPWIPLSCDRNHLPYPANEDFKEYLLRWNPPKEKTTDQKELGFA